MNKIKEYFQEISKIIKKPWLLTVFFLIFTVSSISAGKAIINNKAEEKKEESVKKPVLTAMVDPSKDEEAFIETVGTIKAESQIDILATNRGTLKNLYFAVGEEVAVNKILAVLYDNATLTSLNNAKTNLDNTKNNKNAAERTSEEAVKQAEIGVLTAEKSVKQAEIGLKTARDNLKNAKEIRIKSNQDAKNRAVISFNGFLNSIFLALDSVDSLLHVEKMTINPNQHLTDPGLGAKDPESVRSAISLYKKTKELYDEIKNSDPTAENIAEKTEKITLSLDNTEQMLAKAVYMLDNSVSGQNLSMDHIESQKNNLSGLRSSVISAQTSAKSTLQTLENLGLIEEQEFNSLENALAAAETQLEIAKTAYNNSLIVLENAKQSKEQQSVSLKSSVDNAKGQYDLALSSASDLYIKAPISGTITKKYAEIGAEINPGQKILQISQNKNLIIETSLPSKDVYRIKKGGQAIIGDGLAGTINSIDPAADPVSRKVKVEILFDNKNKDLIQGTFTDVVLPAEKMEKTHPDSVFIPLKAVINTQTGSFVFVALEGKAVKKPVSLGKTEGALVEVVFGLNYGDALIVEGAKNLEEGDELEISKDQ